MEDLEDKFTGCLVGVGVGDALGMPAEGMTPKQLGIIYGQIRDYHEGWLKPGYITDDTQLTICIAESIVEHRDFVPEDVAQRFVGWLGYGRGKGRTCTMAVLNLIQGKSWKESGLFSAGNGSAMRSAPIGLFYYKDYERLKRIARDSSIITHTDPMAIAGATAVAFSVAYCLSHPHDFDVLTYIRELTGFISDISDRMAERISLLLDCLNKDSAEVLARLRPGAFVLESLPAAIYCFIRSPYDFEETVITGVNGGYDADTVASMAGGISGALNGLSGIPARWIEGLEEGEKLMELGRKMARFVENL